MIVSLSLWELVEKRGSDGFKELDCYTAIDRSGRTKQ